jgi:hypothetical protein
MPIRVETDNDKQLTRFIVTGEATFEEGLSANRAFYAGNPTKNVIWDFSEALLNKIASDQFRQIVDSVKHLVEKRKDGKTAFLTSRDLEFGIARMLQVFTEMNEPPIYVQVFKSMDEVARWFAEDE